MRSLKIDLYKVAMERLLFLSLHSVTHFDNQKKSSRYSLLMTSIYIGKPSVQQVSHNRLTSRKVITKKVFGKLHGERSFRARLRDEREIDFSMMMIIFFCVLIRISR